MRTLVQCLSLPILSLICLGCHDSESARDAHSAPPAKLSHPVEEIQQVLTTEELLDAQRQVRQIFVHQKVRDYIVQLVQATRAHPDIGLGASPRGSLALLRCAQAQAAADGVSFILPDHVKAMVEPALAHRLILTPEARLAGRRPAIALNQITSRTEAPVGEAFAED